MAGAAQISKGIQTVGTCLAVAAGCPVTHDQAGFEALDWSNSTIEVENYGEVGGNRNIITWGNPCTGQVSKRPGVNDEGTHQIAMTHVIDDPAQVLLKAHFRTGEPVSVRITYVNGDVDYYTGYVTARPKQIGGDGDHIMMSVTVAIDGEIIEVDTP